MTFEIVEPNQGAKIKVIGLGGAGGNAINNMIEAGMSGVEFIVANTDAQDLEKSKAPVKLQIGEGITRGLGAGVKPEIGRSAAEESLTELKSHLEGADLVFITAGLGGGTGTGSAPVVADVAKEIGALTIAVTTMPFTCEGSRKTKVAQSGARELEGKVDTILTIPNDKLLSIGDKNSLALDMFKMADDILLKAVRGVSDLINKPGRINVDFNDLKTVMQEKGLALIGTGKGVGENKAEEAANAAISSPLMEDISIHGARGLMINITSGRDLTMPEFYQTISIIQQEVDEEAEVIMGWVLDENMNDEINVTVVATGLGARKTEVISTDMSEIKREAVVEIMARAEGDNIDFPAYHRESGMDLYRTQKVVGGNMEINPNDTEIPTFLRRNMD
jgi:cell division protein FtsZ